MTTGPRRVPVDPRQSAPPNASRVPGRPRAASLRDRLRGPWRVAVAEASMTPSIADGDWLLMDPTTARWPRRGAVVVFREPGTDVLAVKRVAGRPGDWVPFADAWLQLEDDEAWLLSDASEAEVRAAGFGAAVDSRSYGPVPVEALVGRVWFRYWPLRRLGPVRWGAAPGDGHRPR